MESEEITSCLMLELECLAFLLHQVSVMRVFQVVAHMDKSMGLQAESVRTHFQVKVKLKVDLHLILQPHSEIKEVISILRMTALLNDDFDINACFRKFILIFCTNYEVIKYQEISTSFFLYFFQI